MQVVAKRADAPASRTGEAIYIYTCIHIDIAIDI